MDVFQDNNMRSGNGTSDQIHKLADLRNLYMMSGQEHDRFVPLAFDELDYAMQQSTTLLPLKLAVIHSSVLQSGDVPPEVLASKIMIDVDSIFIIFYGTLGNNPHELSIKPHKHSTRYINVL